MNGAFCFCHNQFQENQVNNEMVDLVLYSENQIDQNIISDSR